LTLYNLINFNTWLLVNDISFQLRKLKNKIPTEKNKVNLKNKLKEIVSRKFAMLLLVSLES
jgi:hypothetical protein